MASDDPVVLSYFDCLLHESDRQLLNHGQWLNDNLIEFVFEYFSRNLFKDRAEEILFVPPATTQFLKMAPSEASAVLDPLDFAKKSFSFFAVNDNEYDAIGGTHWSLLLHSSQEQTAYHLDSSGSANRRPAAQLAKTLGKYLKQNVSMLDVKCPQQPNQCDCGVYLICFCELIAHNLVPSSKIGDRIEIWVKNLCSQNVTDKRKEVLSLICKFN